MAFPAVEAIGDDIRRERPTTGCIARVPRMCEHVGDNSLAGRWRKREKTT